MSSTSHAARGKWRGILLALGMEEKFLNGKHGPCPICGGTDRARWDNKEGSGSFICNVCGAGDGFGLLRLWKGWDFKTAAAEIDKIIGNVRAEPPKPRLDDAKCSELQLNLWKGAQPLTGDDLASLYLIGRNVLPGRIPPCLRLHPNCPVPHNGGFLPAMLARVDGQDGSPVNVHRTFLGANGKADMDNPRAMMPGTVPDGSAVRLYPVHGERLGIAEGIETAIAAAKRFKVSVWAALNSSMLEKWVPPAGVSEVLIFGDNDRAFGGQASAYSLAHRLTTRLRMKAQVMIPETAGMDWADELEKSA